MTTPQSTPAQAGIAVSTAITAGLFGVTLNHGEGIVVSKANLAGNGGDLPGERQQHAEGIVVSTAITAGIGGGDIPGERNQHAEGIVVSTAITAGRDGVTLNHAEAVVGL
jgi:phosphotransferase system  glucose/maltose/N-acetylglucosamine-specific IIC component